MTYLPCDRRTKIASPQKDDWENQKEETEAETKAET